MDWVNALSLDLKCETFYAKLTPYCKQLCTSDKSCTVYLWKQTTGSLRLTTVIRSWDAV